MNQQEPDMARLEIPSARGHDVIEFDRTVDENHPSVREAMEAFNDLVGKQGMTAVTKNPGDASYTIARNFKDVQEQTTFKRQLQGG
jgi:hypothetical protein